MASAKRLMELRQPCLKSSRIAEMSVPAWPMPIHQTKLMMANPQATGCVMAQMPTPLRKSQVTRHHEHGGAAAGHREEAKPAHRRVRREHDAHDLLGDRPEGLARRNDAVFAGCRIDPMLGRFYFLGRHRQSLFPCSPQSLVPSPFAGRAPPASLPVPGSDSELRPHTCVRGRVLMSAITW